MYNPILTAIGKIKIAAAIANNTTLSLSEMAVGDSNGVSYTPIESQVSLQNETYRIGLSSLYVNPSEPNLVEMIGVIPSTVGGFIVREVAIFDIDGDMIAISDFPAFEKSTATTTATPLEIRFLIKVSNSNVITLNINDLTTYASIDSVLRLEKSIENINAKVHNDTSGRDAEDCHPISAISGLNSVISNLNCKLFFYGGF